MSAPLVADIEDLMSTHVLLNLLSKLRKRLNGRLAEHFISFLQRVKQM